MATLHHCLTQHICNLTYVFRMSYEIRTNLSRLMRDPTYKNVAHLTYTLSLIFCNELEKDSDTERTMLFSSISFQHFCQLLNFLLDQHVMATVLWYILLKLN